MEATAPNPCVECQRLQEQLQQLQATVARLEEQLAAARKDSSTSSKPPSSDIVKPSPPPPPPGQEKRKIGAQPGHPKHERALFPPEQVNDLVIHPLQDCPCCGGPLRRNGDLISIVQQVDVQLATLQLRPTA
jgi:transposase